MYALSLVIQFVLIFYNVKLINFKLWTYSKRNIEKINEWTKAHVSSQQVQSAIEC